MKFFLSIRKMRGWGLVRGETLDPDAVSEVSDGEKDYAALWKDFFDAVSIRGASRIQNVNEIICRFVSAGDMTEFGPRSSG